MESITFRSLLSTDYRFVKEIYELGIATGNATFQTETPSWESWDKDHLGNARIVALDETTSVVGWAALTAVSGRCVYAGVAEVSIYIHPRVRGRGVGKKLLSELITQSEKESLWTLQAGIFPENKASMKIHEQCGFRQIGYREKIGKMNARWRDIMMLERRSKIVGV
jgi:phosphinothricin acetyltransferase